MHKVREGRNKIICLGNDLKEITNKIKEGLDNLHSQSAQSVPKTLQSVNLAEVIACLFPKHLFILLLNRFYSLIDKQE